MHFMTATQPAALVWKPAAFLRAVVVLFMTVWTLEQESNDFVGMAAVVDHL